MKPSTVLRREKWRAVGCSTAIAIALLLTLSGCNNVRTRLLCIPIPHYTLQEQKQLANEREADPNSPETDRQIEDWNRFQIKANECLKRQ